MEFNEKNAFLAKIRQEYIERYGNEDFDISKKSNKLLIKKYYEIKENLKNKMKIK